VAASTSPSAWGRSSSLASLWPCVARTLVLAGALAGCVSVPAAPLRPLERPDPAPLQKRYRQLYTDAYDELFKRYATAYGLPWKHLKAQAIAESALDPFAVSAAGACGLCQFMPRTWDEVAGRNASPFDPEHSIAAQAKYMDWLRKALGTNHWPALWAAYNWGIGSVRTHLKGWGYLNIERLPRETRHYIDNIETALKRLGPSENAS
jgi:soluble lytic murein transglycosylase-like protein